MIENLDYIQDLDDNFWIISCIEKNRYIGYIVYKVDSTGDRKNNITNKMYKKQMFIRYIEIPNEYKRLFKPKEFYIKNKHTLTGVWAKLVYVLNEIGVKDEDIGIFGSYLIGFDVIKDIDFVLYGTDALKLVYENINFIREQLDATPISLDHINYQYKKHKSNYDIKCDIKQIISRNWSGLQLKQGILSTLRFIDYNNMCMPEKLGKEEILQCKIVDSLHTACQPRHAKVLVNNETFNLFTPLWKYQSFGRTNDNIEIRGVIDYTNKNIILDNPNHYIRFI